MKVRKKNRTAQMNPKTLKNVVGKSEYKKGRKGGITHTYPREGMNEDKDHSLQK